MEIGFNVNDPVKFRLTKHGRQIFKRNYCDANPKVDKEGYVSMQLWEVMNVFGPEMYVGNPSPVFVDNKIWL